uniref:Protein kinase domain-containing protein n=1 Tax=Panagrolaimus davidi TaxID=227884 RepID=A0A914P2H6_9BILA
MTGGDLESYHENPDRLLLLSTIFSYIFQSLDAMAYLSHKHIMHRDLAVRNCLLNDTYEKLKLNDFGLSRETNKDYEYISETNPQLPFRWHPLETLVQGFTDKGDIWSFGILIWDMFERGRDLYDGMGLVALRTFLYDGGRLAQPTNCPDELYQIMKRCWNRHPENRPNFDVLQIDIKNVFEQIKANGPYSLNKSIECNNFIEIINPNYVYEKPNSL